MTPQHTYESLKNSLLSVEKHHPRNELSEHEHEALSDVLSALNFGKTAYLQHCSLWLNDENNPCNFSQDDVEYLKALKCVVGFIEN